MGYNDVITLQGGFAPVEEEITVELTQVQGVIPRDLHGMHVRNGPNRRFEAPGRYHWFDGDGMLHAVRFEGGRAFYQTAGFTPKACKRKPRQATRSGKASKTRRATTGPRCRSKTRPTPTSNTSPAICWPCGTWVARCIACGPAT